MQARAQSCAIFPARCPFGGACHTCPAHVQPKLTVNQPGDRYEQEADQIADRVLRMPEPGMNSPHIQRACPGCEEELQRQIEPEEEEEETVQAKPLAAEISPLVQRQAEPEEEEEEEPVQASRQPGRAQEVAPGLAGSVRALQGGGRPLPTAARAFFEPRFGADFSQVRIHDNAAGAESAQALQARAFTLGQHIAFAPGQYNVNTQNGRFLLAHELTHVIQQGAARAPSNQVQRLVRRTRVSCTAPDGSFRNPYSADRRAASLLTRAIERIDSALANRAADPAHADVVAVGRALRRAFRLNPNRNSTWTLGPPNVRLPVIRRRLEIARDYINSVVFRYECPTVGGPSTMPCGTCAAGEEAFVCTGTPADIALCPLFWTRSRNQQGRIIAHEVLHLTFGFIADWGQPDVHNAHCYAQFTALLNGFNSPAGFRCH